MIIGFLKVFESEFNKAISNNGFLTSEYEIKIANISEITITGILNKI